MKLTKTLSALLISSCLFGPYANAALTFWTSNDLMIIYGKTEKSDIERLREALSPSIKTVVLRSPNGMDFDVARDIGGLIEKANVTTVVHGRCHDLICAMIFLSGTRRQFSGVQPLTAHTLSLGIGESGHVLADTQTRVTDIHEWWQNHTKLNRADLSLHRESFFTVIGNKSKFDRKVFFPAKAGFSKGDVLHCVGSAQSQNLVDCLPVPGVSALGKGVITSEELFTDTRLTEPADLKAPSTTDFSALASPLSIASGDKCKAMYQEFLKQDKPRAFVVGNNESCHWASLGFRPNERAMQNCKKNAPTTKECRFYAVDDSVVFTPF